MSNREKKPNKNVAVSPISGCPPPTNGGRKKGVQNKATLEFKQALTNLFDYAAPEMVDWLKQVDSPERRFDILSKFADYLFPKLGRQEVQQLDKNGQPADAVSKIVIEHVSAKKE